MQPGDYAPKMKEVYAHLGYAMFLGQTLEGLLSQAVFALIEIPSHRDTVKAIAEEGSLDKWEAFIDSLDRKRLRKKLVELIQMLSDSGSVTADVIDCLDSARKDRNFVAHNFFKEHLAKLYHNAGQDAAIAYLGRTCVAIQKAIDQLHPLVFEQFATYGYDQEFVKSQCMQIIAEAK